jgi:hypothetical protein
VWLNRKVFAGLFAALMLCTGLEVFRPAVDGQRVLQRAWTILGSAESTPEQVARAVVDYRDALRALLPGVEKHSRDLATASLGEELSGYYRRDLFAEISPIRQSRETTAGLHRSGLGLPAIGSIVPGGNNAPLAGYRVPLTLLAFPKESAPTSFEVRLADPSRIGSIRVGDRTFPVAMDLEAALDASHATGPRFLDGLGYLLRSDRKRSRLTLLQPYDPEKFRSS